MLFAGASAYRAPVAAEVCSVFFPDVRHLARAGGHSFRTERPLAFAGAFDMTLFAALGRKCFGHRRLSSHCRLPKTSPLQGAAAGRLAGLPVGALAPVSLSLPRARVGVYPCSRRCSGVQPSPPTAGPQCQRSSGVLSRCTSQTQKKNDAGNSPRARYVHRCQ